MNTKVGKMTVVNEQPNKNMLQMKIVEPIKNDGPFESLRDPYVMPNVPFPHGKDFEEAPIKLSSMYRPDKNPIATQHLVTLAGEKLAELLIRQTKTEATIAKKEAKEAQIRLDKAKHEHERQLEKFSEENKKAQEMPSQEATEKHLRQIVVHSGYDPRSAHYLRKALEARNAWNPKFFKKLKDYHLNEVAQLPGVPDDVMKTFKEVWMRLSKEGNAELEAAAADIAKSRAKTADVDVAKAKKNAAFALIQFCAAITGDEEIDNGRAAEQSLEDIAGITLASVVRDLINRFQEVSSIPGLKASTKQKISNVWDKISMKIPGAITPELRSGLQKTDLTLMQLLEELLADSGPESLADMFIPETAEQLYEAWCAVKGGDGCESFKDKFHGDSDDASLTASLSKIAIRKDTTNPTTSSSAQTLSLAQIADEMTKHHGSVAAIEGLSEQAKRTLQQAWEKSGGSNILLTAEERAAEAHEKAKIAAEQAARADALATGKSKSEQIAAAKYAREEMSGDEDDDDAFVLLEAHLEKIESISSNFKSCNHGVHAEVVSALAAMEKVKDLFEASRAALSQARKKVRHESLRLQDAEGAIEETQKREGLSKEEFDAKQSDEKLMGGSPTDLMGPPNVPIEFSGPSREEMIRRTMESVGQ